MRPAGLTRAFSGRRGTQNPRSQSTGSELAGAGLSLASLLLRFPVRGQREVSRACGSHAPSNDRPFQAATHFPQEEIFQDEFPVTGSKRSTTNPTRYFTSIDGLRSGFDFDDLIKCVAVWAAEMNRHSIRTSALPVPAHTRGAARLSPERPRRSSRQAAACATFKSWPDTLRCQPHSATSRLSSDRR